MEGNKKRLISKHFFTLYFEKQIFSVPVNEGFHGVAGIPGNMDGDGGAKTISGSGFGGVIWATTREDKKEQAESEEESQFLI